MRPATLALFAALALAAAGAPGTAAPVPKHLQKEPETDKAKLQGRWQVTALQMGGKDVLAALGPKIDMVIEFKDDALTMTATIGGTVQKSTATLTYGAAEVRQIQMSNMQVLDGNGAPQNGGPKEDAFGYAFNGDKLLLAATTGAGDKKKGPAPDPLKPGPSDAVIVLTRIKN